MSSKGRQSLAYRIDNSPVHRLFDARSRMRDSLLQPLNLSELARQAGMSPFHFLRLFRATFGQTPHRLTIEFRLARAKELLVETDVPVTEICFECGYESLGSFSHLFRRIVGCSPREYRQRRRRRFWSAEISFLRTFVPFCLIDGFRGGFDGEQFSRSIFPAPSVSLR